MSFNICYRLGVEASLFKPSDDESNSYVGRNKNISSTAPIYSRVRRATKVSYTIEGKCATTEDRAHSSLSQKEIKIKRHEETLQVQAYKRKHIRFMTPYYSQIALNSNGTTTN
jgi:hypothetical protein